MSKQPVAKNIATTAKSTGKSTSKSTGKSTRYGSVKKPIVYEPVEKSAETATEDGAPRRRAIDAPLPRDRFAFDDVLDRLPKNLPTREEQYKLSRRAKRGDRDAFELLVMSCIRWVVVTAKQIARYSDSVYVEDLISVGNAELVRQTRRYKPETPESATLLSFCKKAIYAKMKDTADRDLYQGPLSGIGRHATKKARKTSAIQRALQDGREVSAVDRDFVNCVTDHTRVVLDERVAVSIGKSDENSHSVDTGSAGRHMDVPDTYEMERAQDAENAADLAHFVKSALMSLDPVAMKCFLLLRDNKGKGRTATEVNRELRRQKIKIKLSTCEALMVECQEQVRDYLAERGIKGWNDLG